MKRDENEKEIVEALENIGCTVFRMDTPVDLLVGRGGRNILIEIKNPSTPKSSRKKTEAQDKFFGSWYGQVCICETAQDAIDLVTSSTINN